MSARVRSVVPLKSAELAYTTDDGPWRRRNWQTVPARLDARTGEIAVELPARHGITWFMTVTDARVATVSSEHQTVPRETSSQPAA